MTSTIGRRPVTAAPNAAPASASSEMGVSNTRAAPKRSCSPGVTLNTPPGAATSSPKKMTDGSRSSSSAIASRMATRNSSSLTARTRSPRRRSDPGKRRRARAASTDCDPRLDGGVERVEALGGDALARRGAHGDGQRVACLPVLDLSARAIVRRGRPWSGRRGGRSGTPGASGRRRRGRARPPRRPPRARPTGRCRRRRRPACRTSRARRRCRAGGDLRHRRELAVEIVLADEDDGQPPTAAKFRHSWK